MAVSVRINPLLEKRLELAARHQGITKSQFIISALERALGDKNPYALMLQAKAEMARDARSAGLTQAFIVAQPVPHYDTERSRADLIAKLRAKHGISID
jgi:RHH-type rel operon transcriptional repressor/antitoxin RelB